MVIHGIIERVGECRERKEEEGRTPIPRECIMANIKRITI